MYLHSILANCINPVFLFEISSQQHYTTVNKFCFLCNELGGQFMEGENYLRGDLCDQFIGCGGNLCGKFIFKETKYVQYNWGIAVIIQGLLGALQHKRIPSC